MDALFVCGMFDHRHLGTFRCRREGASTPSKAFSHPSNQRHSEGGFEPVWGHLRYGVPAAAEMVMRACPWNKTVSGLPYDSEQIVQRGHEGFVHERHSTKAFDQTYVPDPSKLPYKKSQTLS
jgi:hypothetical protein